jgi:hypothetical protein
MLACLQFAQITLVTRPHTRRQAPVFLLVFLALTANTIPLRAQQTQPPAGAIGRVDGSDVSIETGGIGADATTTSGRSMFVTNGSVITVHSGEARMTLLGGGEVDVCGPAKFTVLQSGAAITLALNFGRMRVQLPAAAQLRIFTPTIVATPIDIGGAPRDFTVGLDLNDSLCVVATSGALRLEHQFTGEGLIVPQVGEFFLAAGKLLPVAGVAGSCQCVSLQARATPPLPPSPEMGLTSKPQPTPQPAPEAAPPAQVATVQPAQPAPAPASEVHEPAPAIQIRQLAIANQIHPNSPPHDNEAPPAPAISIPIYKVVMPPLTFSVDAPAPPGEPSTDMILLVRIAHVEPEWQFNGHVEAPQLQQVVAHESSKGSSASGSAQSSQKKKGGFWAALRRAFGGRDETQN